MDEINTGVNIPGGARLRADEVRPVVISRPVSRVFRARASGRPIVFEKKKKKKGKRKYSGRGFKLLQRGVRGSLTVSRRMADAFSTGFTEFSKRSNRSSRKKRDGLLRDVFKNSARSMGKSLRKSSKVPRAMVKVFGGGRGIRRQIRSVRWLFP
jgi:hypothetical protein